MRIVCFQQFWQRKVKQKMRSHAKQQSRVTLPNAEKTKRASNNLSGVADTALKQTKVASSVLLRDEEAQNQAKIVSTGIYTTT